MKATDPIGFFDSGLGGVSVLRQTRRLLSAEDYIYYGDSLHAPYGVRAMEEVQELSLRAAEYLLELGVKAIVLACNTATSAAAAVLRQRYPQLPIIGTEPALKPAVERHPGGRILILATAMTLKEQKFLDLWAQYRDQAEVIPVPCSGLMEFVERGELEGEAVEGFLREKLAPFLERPLDAVVLGCTHYPFLAPVIRHLVGPGAEILDSAEGVSRQLRRQLERLSLLQARPELGQIRFCCSLEDSEMERRFRLLLEWEAGTGEAASLR